MVQARANSSSWVAMTSVRPSARSCMSSAPRSFFLAGSSAAVGSSKSSTARIDGQRAGDGNPLRFAARELPRQRVGPMFDAERRQQLPATPLGIARRQAVRVHGCQTDVVQGGEMLEQAVKLEHHPNLPAKCPERVS